MILGASSYTLRRFAAGTVVGGRYTDGAVTTSTVQASVQPTTGRDVAHLEEGQRQAVELKAYTQTLLRPTDQAATPKVQADELVIDGEAYEVVEVQQQRSIIPHYRVLLMRRTTP